jgi:hypothetical protein
MIPFSYSFIGPLWLLGFEAQGDIHRIGVMLGNGSLFGPGQARFCGQASKPLYILNLKALKKPPATEALTDTVYHDLNRTCLGSEPSFDQHLRAPYYLEK